MQPYMPNRGPTLKATLLDTASLTDEVEFDFECKQFKITPEDDTNLAAGTVSFLVNGKVVYLSGGTQVQMTYSVDFVWTVTLDAPARRISLATGAPAAGGDVIFQITGYQSEPG